MKTILAVALPSLLLLTSCASPGPSPEEQRLSAENEQLRAELKALRNTAANPVPIAQAPQQAAAPAKTASASSSGLNFALPDNTISGPGTYQPPSAPPAETEATHRVVTPLPPPPPGYRLVKEPDQYSETGCTKVLFHSTADAPWKHSENWEDLHKGMSDVEAESDLGIEHFNVEKGKQTIWQYGKCGSNTQGFVVIENAAVIFWSAPDF